MATVLFGRILSEDELSVTTLHRLILEFPFHADKKQQHTTRRWRSSWQSSVRKVMAQVPS